MATRPDGWPTLADIAKQMDPDGRIAQVSEVLSQTNEIMNDIPLYPSNAPTGHRVTLRSSLPTVNFGRVNQGSPRTKGTTEQRTDTIGILNPISEVDAKLENVSGGNFAKVRANEDDAFLEACSQKMAYTMFYGNEATDETVFTGLAPRLGTGNATVVDSGGSGADNTSIFVVDWHERYCHGIYPMGGKAGLSQRNMGLQRVLDADSNPFAAYCTNYEWALGLTVKDARHIGRVGSIDVSDIATAGGTSYSGPDLILLLVDLYAKMQPKNGALRCIYCNATVWAALTKIAMNKSNLALTMEEYIRGMGFIPHFWGDPIRRVDQIAINEALI